MTADIGGERWVVWEQMGRHTLVSHGARHRSSFEFRETVLPSFESYAQVNLLPFFCYIFLSPPFWRYPVVNNVN